jgi:hypothetical protein
VVFQQWENGERLLNSDGGKWCERLLNSGVSAMGKCEGLLNNDGGKWCERLLNSGVSAMGKLASS